jgi:hypothetical protein
MRKWLMVWPVFLALGTKAIEYYPAIVGFVNNSSQVITKVL